MTRETTVHFCVAAARLTGPIRRKRYDTLSKREEKKKKRKENTEVCVSACVRVCVAHMYVLSILRVLARARVLSHSCIG